MSGDGNTQAVTPYLVLPNCTEAHTWYTKAMGAKVTEVKHPPWDKSDKRVLHSMVKFPNGGVVYMCDDFPDPSKNLKSRLLPKDSPCPFDVHLSYAEGDDASQQFWDKAVKDSGVKVLMKFEKQFWGDKFGKFKDPYGYIWTVGETKSLSKKKKRSLREAETSDATQDSSNAVPPSKKQKTSHVVSGALGIKSIPEQQGLFMDFKVGATTGYDFSKASGEGFTQIMAHIMKNDELKSNQEGCVAISPDDPKTHPVARYSPGFLVKSGVDLSKYETERIKKKTIIACDCYVYLHVGSYNGIAAAWQTANKEFASKGYSCLGNDVCCYEKYLNSPEEVPESELQTEIYIGVKKN